ncbi:MAG: AMP-binding protein [Candidatus Dormibacteraeota bacterium]|nr:AMP-binding protein [Candidatus Dormibacteraeota bacterium]
MTDSGPLDGVVPYPPEFAARYRARGYWEDRTMDQVFGGLFERHADRVALLHRDETITYRQLGRRRAALAAMLHDLGLRRRDRVIMHLPNAPEFLYLYFALQMLGVIPVLALAPHRRLEINHFAKLSGAVAYFGTDAALAAVVQAANPGLRHVVLMDHLRARGGASPPPVDIDPTDPCCLLLSGGTTGVPKLIPRTHNDYVYNSKAAAAVHYIDAESCQLSVAPLAHNMPLACPGVQGFLLHGARVVLSEGTRATEILPLAERHHVTHIAAVPALYIRWLSDESAPGNDMSSVRLLQSGGQRLQPELRRRMGAFFPNAFVQENFGMSEGTLFFVGKDLPEEARMETVGTPVSPDDEVRLCDENGAEVADGEVGELTVRGPYTLRGYYRAPEYNARQFTPDGFYRSGDLMRRHPSGAYLVEGRIKDLVNRGGEKISAEEVENLILMYPAVRNVACVPYPDPVLGERMCACVVPHSGATIRLEELTAFLLDLGMAKFKLPERLEMMEDFPVSAFGKISKRALAEGLRTRSVAWS